MAEVRFAWSGVSAVMAEGTYEDNWVSGVPRQQLAADARVWIWNGSVVATNFECFSCRF